MCVCVLLLQSVKLVWSVGSDDMLLHFAPVIHESQQRNPRNMFSVHLFNTSAPLLDTYHDDFVDVSCAALMYRSRT